MNYGYAYPWQDPKFWVAVSFVVFAFFAIRMGWPKLMAMLDARGSRIAGELAEASRLRAEAETMLRQAEADRQAAIAEAASLIERAMAEAKRVGEAAAAEAEASAGRRERMAMDRIAAAEASALAQVRQAAAEVATAAARIVIAEGFGPDEDAAMIDAAVLELPRALKAA